jgi:hypothetical protein
MHPPSWRATRIPVSRTLARFAAHLAKCLILTNCLRLSYLLRGELKVGDSAETIPLIAIQARIQGTYCLRSPGMLSYNSHFRLLRIG